MDTSESLDHVVAQTHTLATWVSGQDGGLPVPTCPEWTLADLVQHVGATQRMVTMLVAERMTEPSHAFAREVSAPTDPSEWGPWLTRTATEAQEAFGSVTDDTPVWDPSGDSAGVPFWSRRLFGEISVHRADAAATLDLPYELAPEAAVAALEDWLDTLTSRGHWHNRVGFAEAMRGAGQTLHFHATDAPGEWLARREPDRVALERTHSLADVTLSGPADQLLLVISRRLPLEAASTLAVAGDRQLLTHFIDHMDWVTG